MKAAILSVFITSTVGFFLFLAGVSQREATQGTRYHILAANFITYRDAAFAAAVAQKRPGIIPLSAISSLPVGYIPLRAWKAQVQGGYLYVWGPATEAEIAEARDMTHGSAAVGMAQNGAITPARYNAVPLPAFIEPGSLVSVLGLGFDTEAP